MLDLLGADVIADVADATGRICAVAAVAELALDIVLERVLETDEREDTPNAYAA